MAEKIDALLTLDDDYDRRERPDQETLGDMLRQSCARYSYPFECRDLNTAGFGDVMWIAGSNGCYSGEIKKAAEVVGGIDKLEKQLGKQIPNCDHPFIAIYGGIILPAPDGNTYVYTETKSYLKWERAPDAEVEVFYKRRYFNQNYLGLRAKFTRFYTEFGIEVYELPTMAALTEQIIALYRVSNTEGRTFDRLIPEKFYIDEPTQKRRDFMLSLMGIQNAGIAEETADAIASFIETIYPVPTMHRFMLYLSELALMAAPETSGLAKQPLRSSLKEGARKRTIGPAKVAQIMKAVGL